MKIMFKNTLLFTSIFYSSSTLWGTVEFLKALDCSRASLAEIVTKCSHDGDKLDFNFAHPITGRTPLHVTASCTNLPLMEELVAMGANTFNLPEKEYNKTPLELAICHANVAMAQFLAQRSNMTTINNALALVGRLKQELNFIPDHLVAITTLLKTELLKYSSSIGWSSAPKGERIITDTIRLE